MRSPMLGANDDYYRKNKDSIEASKRTKPVENVVETNDHRKPIGYVQAGDGVFCSPNHGFLVLSPERIEMKNTLTIQGVLINIRNVASASIGRDDDPRWGSPPWVLHILFVGGGKQEIWGGQDAASEVTVRGWLHELERALIA